MRISKISQDRLRWDLWAMPNPINVCATCWHFNHYSPKCEEPGRIRQGLSNTFMNYNDYLCSDFKTQKRLEGFLKANPYETEEQIRQLRTNNLNALDLTILTHINKKNALGGSYEIDKIQVEKCSYNKSKLWIFGSVRHWTLYPMVDYYVLEYIGIPISKIGKILVYKNGISLSFSFDHFCECLDQNSLFTIMNDLDQKEINQLKTTHQM